MSTLQTLDQVNSQEAVDGPYNSTPVVDATTHDLLVEILQKLIDISIQLEAMSDMPGGSPNGS